MTIANITNYEQLVASVNKYDFKVGMLVFVKTENILNNFYNNPHWYQHIPIPQTQTQPAGIVTYPTTGGSPSTWITNTGGTTINPNVVNVPNVTVNPDTFEIRKFSEYYNDSIYKVSTVTDNTVNNLKDLLFDYNNSSSGNKNSLGMATLPRTPRRKRYRRQRPNQWQRNGITYNPNQQHISTPTTWPANGNYAVTTGTYTVTTGTISLNSFANNKLFVEGYKSIQDYFSGNKEKVDQEEVWTEKEIEKFESDNQPIPGKPFNGIIVDRFIPVAKTDSGEEISMFGLVPCMYKVLFGDKNCLWLSEDKIIPMKPETCELKPEFREEGK
jgi:hypothetical protein